MAILSTADRQRVYRGLMRLPVEEFGSAPNVLKADLFDAVAATDQWIDDNGASFNSALPAPFRNNASLAQKTLLFCAVALARVSINFLIRVLGEVD